MEKDAQKSKPTIQEPSIQEETVEGGEEAIKATQQEDQATGNCFFLFFFV